MHGAVDAQGDRDAQGEDRDKDIDEHGVLHAHGDDLADILLEERRIAEIPLQHAGKFARLLLRGQAHPAGIAHEDRVVEAHLLAQFVIALLVLLGPQRVLYRLQLIASRVARDQIVEKIHEDGDEEEHNDHIDDALQDVLLHRSVFPSLR